MIENLLNLVKENTQSDIVNNPAIPDNFNGEAVQETSNQIFDGLKNQFSSGNMAGLMGLLNGGSQNVASNPIVTQIVSSLTSSLASKFGVNETQAQGIASSVVTKVISQLISKVNDPNDSSFNLQSMAKEFGGGGIGGMLGGVFGKLF